MKSRILGFVACGFIAFGIVGAAARPTLIAQESGKAAAKAEKGDGTKKAGRSGDRLPANYGKIGVSEDQRKKIYEIQNKYDDQIEVLQKQIADLRAKEKTELEAVLTAEQKKSLQVANEEGQKKAAAKKKASENEKGSNKAEKREKP